MTAKKIARILVPTDFSDCAHAALDYALSLAELAGASVTLLHAWEIPLVLGGMESFTVAVSGAGTQPLALAEVIRTKSTEQMDALLTESRTESRAAVQGEGGAPRVKVTGEVVMGNPVDTVVEASSGYDLVVMGTHGRGLVSHALLGSLAERVVRKAKCPVLTVRHG